VVGDRVFHLIQQRVRGNLSFARNWTEYENGFGDGYDFWIGLRIINELTGNSPRLLRVEAVTWSNVLYVCEYSNFTVGNSTTNYTMNYGSYLTASSNTSMDSLNYHRGRPFTTIDRDNDQNPSVPAPTPPRLRWLVVRELLQRESKWHVLSLCCH
uniref:Fibrinogen C-terminal domain-containing protein n=1 Tax=Macrostomum lignano TaxID=282301 RepID=A0A1I8JFS2_9PLAT